MEAASSLRLTSYNCRGRLLGDELSGKVVIDVRTMLFIVFTFENLNFMLIILICKSVMEILWRKLFDRVC